MKERLQVAMRILKRCAHLFIFAITSFWCLSAPAGQLWNLQGVSFSDGATATGYLVWDDSAPNGSMLVDFNVIVSGGDVATFSSYTYKLATSSQVIGRNDIYNLDGVQVPVSFALMAASDSAVSGRPRQLRFAFSPFLAPSSQAVSIYVPDPKFGGLTPVECFNCGPFRAIVAGEVIAAVPEPSNYAMLLCGFGLLAIVRRRMRASRTQFNHNLS